MRLGVVPTSTYYIAAIIDWGHDRKVFIFLSRGKDKSKTIASLQLQMSIVDAAFCDAYGLGKRHLESGMN